MVGYLKQCKCPEVSQQRCGIGIREIQQVNSPCRSVYIRLCGESIQVVLFAFSEIKIAVEMSLFSIPID